MGVTLLFASRVQNVGDPLQNRLGSEGEGTRKARCRGEDSLAAQGHLQGRVKETQRAEGGPETKASPRAGRASQS